MAEEATYIVHTKQHQVHVTSDGYVIDSLGALNFRSGGSDVVMFSPGYWRYVYKEGSAEPLARRSRVVKHG